MPRKIPRVTAYPLLAGERGGLAAALERSGLPVDEVDAPGRHFWRFATPDELPVGFGGIEVHGKDALLRSIVTLPPLRGRGFAKAMITALETEAAVAGCRAVWLITQSKSMFEQLGYYACDMADVPEAINTTTQFTLLRNTGAAAMVKRL